MKELISLTSSKHKIRNDQNNKIITKNVIRSRIPVRIPFNENVTVVNPKPNTSSTAQTKSVSTLPEKPYGKDRTRLVSSYGKRFGKSALESQISFKYRKYNWEKSKLIRQQLNYERECDEMKLLLEKMKTNAIGDCPNQSGCLLGTQDSSSDRRREEISSVHHKFIVSNIEIFTLLKGLGEKAIQLYYYQTMNKLNKKSNQDLNFFANISDLKTKCIKAAKEGHNKFLEFEQEINQLKAINKDLKDKLKLAEQSLVTQATENKSIQEGREESFTKIEERLRDIIEKLQCQFRAQKLLQAKTERELAILRSDFFTVERENSKLNVEFTSCSNELKDCQKVNGTLKDKIASNRKENEEIIKRYEEQLVASHRTIDRMENELIDSRNKNNEHNAAHMNGNRKIWIVHTFINFYSAIINYNLFPQLKAISSTKKKLSSVQL